MRFLKIGIVLSLIIAASACTKDNSGSIPDNQVTINGTVYPTVTIGNQVWTTQNYSGPGGGEVVTTTGDPIANGNYYNSTDINLPAEWRVPTRQDYNTLFSNYSTMQNASGDVLVGLTATQNMYSTSGWQGITTTNSTGLNIYSAGLYVKPNPTPVENKLMQAVYLTSTKNTVGNTQYYVTFSYAPYSYNGFSYYNYINSINPGDLPNVFLSVRFVKDK